MNFRTVSSIGALLALGAGFAAFPASHLASAAPPVASAAVPRVNFKTRTLANGLMVYSLARHDSPTVAIQVWYKVGSKDDPKGRSGFAHLFEHIMFKATKNMKAEMMDRLTEDVGGENNAFTESDVTVYHETVPSNYLETLLWAEADRMANLKVDEANFLSERLVVEEEFRTSVLAQPYGRLGLLTASHSYTKPAYGRDTIGSISDLDAATLDDVRKFHDTYYRPDNAVLVVVGDFDDAQMNRYVDKYFGRIARPSTPIPQADGTEPARTALQSFHETAPAVPLPSVTETYLTPGIRDADVPALRIADSILTGGDSARLHHALVYDQRVASNVSTYGEFHPTVGLFTAAATSSSGTPLDKVSGSLLAEIDRLKAAPPTAAELTRARNQLLTQDLDGRETNSGLASSIGDAAVLEGDANSVNTELTRLSAVTPADVQRVAARYFTDTNRVEIRYSDGPDSLGIKPSTAAAVATMPKVAGASEAGMATGAVESPPMPSAARPVHFPATTSRRLPNGLQVIVASKPGSGLVTANLVVKMAGAGNEAEKQAGIARFTATLLTRGTKTRSATDLASQIETLGTSISARSGWDSTTVGLTALRQNLPESLAIMADVVLRPAFSPAEVSRLRTESLDEIKVSLQSPRNVATAVAARAVFNTLPYGHPAAGTVKTIGALTGADVQAFHRQNFIAEHACLVFAGDITPDAAFALAQQRFGSWRSGGPAGLMVMAKMGPLVIGGSPAPLIVIDKPDAGQAAVVIARSTIYRDAPDYYAAEATNAVLGGGYSARLNEEVRIKRGLSYGAGSSLDERLLAGSFTATAQTKNASAGQVAELVLAEIARMASEPVAPAELKPRVSSLVGGYVRRIETGSGLAGQIGALAALDRPLSDLSAYVTRVKAVTPAEIRHFARVDLTANDSVIVIVGNASAFLPDLKARVKRPVTVIPFRDLDLDRELPVGNQGKLSQLPPGCRRLKPAATRHKVSVPCAARGRRLTIFASRCLGDQFYSVRQSIPLSSISAFAIAE